ncbi:MAG: hypothetical protein IKQ62_06830, partial [Bacteroidaceae bacterium]|nr:hypothetical protein [Bacteroidaceae bacterium]
RLFTRPKAVFHVFSPEIPCFGHLLRTRIHQHRKSLYPTGYADEKKAPSQEMDFRKSLPLKEIR